MLAGVLEDLRYASSPGLVTSDRVPSGAAAARLWRDLNRKIGPEALFFSGQVPLMAFVDLRNRDLEDVQSTLWNVGKVPLLLAAGKKRTSIYAADLRRPSGSSAVLVAESKASSGLREFARDELESGRALAHVASQRLSGDKVDRALLRNLSYLRSSVGKDRTRTAAMDALVGGALLVRYLHDRRVLDPRHLQELTGFPDLFDVLEHGPDTAAGMFALLAERFNGDVFGALPISVRGLTQQDTSRVAALLRGDDLASGQTSLFPYDFSVIPTDLLSGVYEQLLAQDRRDQAAHYTPPWLAEVVLDEVLPWDGAGTPTVCDPACGSGTFLVSAFRRLAHRVRRDEGNLTFERARSLLVECVHGKDLNPVAASTTVFGLYLALLEELDNRTVWTSTVLPSLAGTNVITGDAFEGERLGGLDRYDLVVGNPPWMSRLTPAARTWVNRAQSPVADQQLAEAFLWRAASVLAEGGRLSLLLPAKPVLHNPGPRAIQFRRHLFSDLRVETIVDLSRLRLHGLFPHAAGAAALVVAQLKTPQPGSHRESGDGGNEGPGNRGDNDTAETSLAEDSRLLYVAVPPHPAHKVIEGLVLADSDVRRVPPDRDPAAPGLWQTRLLGGEQDEDIVARLRSLPTLGELVEDRGWISGRGYQRAGGGSLDPAGLQDLPVVDASRVSPFTLDPAVAGPLPPLHRTRSRNHYRAPLLLVRRSVTRGRLVAAFSDEDVLYPDTVIGFAAPEQDAPLLRVLEAVLNSSFAVWWHLMTGSTLAVERGTVDKVAHEGLPWPADGDELDATALAEVVAVARHRTRRSSDWQTHLDAAVFDIYGLNQFDRLVIKQALGRMTDPSLDYSRPGEVIAEQYRTVIRDILSGPLESVHHDVYLAFGTSPYGVLSVVLEPGLTEGPPAVGPILQAATALEEASPGRSGSAGLLIRKTTVLLEGNSVHVVKPAEGRLWSANEALKDARTVVSALMTAT